MRYIKEIAEAGADIITFHYETVEDPNVAIAEIHNCGKKAGMAIKPGTPVDVIEPYLDSLDMILVMTVEPGFGGQKFDPAAKEKLSWVQKHSDPDMLLSVDGGVNETTLPACRDCGASGLVMGTAVFCGRSIEEQFGKLDRELQIR